jgi:hypothetical protein
MTPEERANEIMDTVKKIDIGGFPNIKEETAKRMALLFINSNIEYSRHKAHVDYAKYLEEVKQEIEKL